MAKIGSFISGTAYIVGFIAAFAYGSGMDTSAPNGYMNSLFIIALVSFAVAFIAKEVKV